METEDVVQYAGFAARNAPKFYWYATVAALAHPKLRSKGITMAGYGFRATVNMARAAGGALLDTPFKYKGKTTMKTAGKAAPKFAVRGVTRIASNPYVMIGLVAGEMAYTHYQMAQSDPVYAKAFVGGMRGIYL